MEEIVINGNRKLKRPNLRSTGAAAAFCQTLAEGGGPVKSMLGG
jgi:hypothetical protein